MILVFLCIAQINVGANVFTGALTNNKFARLVVEKYQRATIQCKTRASAWRGTNTHSRCHFLMYTNNLSMTMIKGKFNGP